jgi:hypothetical protein
MKRLIMAIFMMGIAIAFSGCYWNVGKIKMLAEERLYDAGFEIITRAGTQMSFTGGNVWYVLKKAKTSDKGIYEACLSYMVSGDLGIYNIRSIDVIEVRSK